VTSTPRLEHTLLAEILTALQQAANTQTETAATLRGLSTNNVLHTALVQLDADGTAELRSSVPAGSIAVANHSTHDVTVSAAPKGAGAPTVGHGVHRVGAGKAAVVNLTGTVLTLYGTAGDAVSVQVFSKAQPPAFGVA